ncbi:type IV secretion system protein [Pseudomonas syringae]|uniref:virB8 family protein n=1 Tax=Pseudomonas syringae TaxID=317 RepID=UPI0018E64E0A|nr:type IV secretion system protein [Pseudomonas syringae]MBI6746872.1 type IV secretion system protein [Pseudomonas syringae]MBI6794996.1 type IV secretion system protein [Pseudomonas syringae]
MKKFRKSKEDVIEQERQLAARTSIDAATAQEISLVEQAWIHAARYFEKSIAADEKAKTKRATRLNYVFGTIAVMSVAAVMGLTPLKTVQLGLVRVDRNSGYSDVVWADDKGKPQEQIDDEFWLSAYTRFRESYNFSSNDANYSMVKLMSYDETFTEYRNFQLSSKGYLEVLGTNRQIRTDINNINFLDRKDREGTAQVRITKTVLDRNGVPDPQLHPVTWVATVTYDYKNPAKKAGDQWLNPRGFGIKAYTMTQEVGVSNGK